MIVRKNKPRICPKCKTNTVTTTSYCKECKQEYDASRRSEQNNEQSNFIIPPGRPNHKDHEEFSNWLTTDEGFLWKMEFDRINGLNVRV